MTLPTQILIAGGGIGGLAAALVCHRAGHRVQVLEQASAFSEMGAGLQLGPNAVRVLELWGLGDAVRAVSARPQHLQVRDAGDGRLLGAMRLGAAFRARYGADYLTLHRADLHQLLYTAVQASGVDLQLKTIIKIIAKNPYKVRAICDKYTDVSVESAVHYADALMGCDGLWSQVRAHLLQDDRPRPTGYCAYRAMLAAADVPPDIAQDQVTVWLGAQMHAVAYPVRGGALFNVVVIVREGINAKDQVDMESWGQQAHGETLIARLSHMHSQLLNLISTAPDWTHWVLHDRDPVQGPHQMVKGCIALLGDAAHPMRPYLAQGAAMALEDAQALGAALARSHHLPTALQAYAAARWQRNARVQAQSRRNGHIFHAAGPLRVARNLAMTAMGERLLDTRWLYEGGLTP
jgi:salicylate hydroxylase